MVKNLGSKLNEETSVPFAWLVASIIFACSGAWTTAGMWFSVKTDIHELKTDVRFLKQKAGIKNMPELNEETSNSKKTIFINTANASVKTQW